MIPSTAGATPSGDDARRGSLPGHDGSPHAGGPTALTIETVTGPIDADAIGLALPHEHLFVDLLGPTHAARLTWAHAQDSTLEENLELAARGVTISLDAIGLSDDSEMVDRIERLAEYGYRDRILVSTDTSVWVNPPELAYERSIEYLLGTFLPLVSRRLGAGLRDGLVRGNVLRALGRPGPRAEHRTTHGPLISKES